MLLCGLCVNSLNGFVLRLVWIPSLFVCLQKIQESLSVMRASTDLCTGNTGGGKKKKQEEEEEHGPAPE